MLRAINLGATNRIAMADLKALHERLGHEDVRTYILSGNVVFKTPAKSEAKVKAAIEKRIRDDLGLDITAIIRTAAQMKGVVKRNPFVGAAGAPPQLHVTFLDRRAPRDAQARVAGPQVDPDEFHIDGREVYIHLPAGYGVSRLGNAFWEKKLGVRATNRNWTTVQRLAEMAAG